MNLITYLSFALVLMAAQTLDDSWTSRQWRAAVIIALAWPLSCVLVIVYWICVRNKHTRKGGEG